MRNTIFFLTVIATASASTKAEAQEYNWKNATDEEIASSVAAVEAAAPRLEESNKSKALQIKGLYAGIPLSEAELFHPGITEWCEMSRDQQDGITNCKISVYGRKGKFEFRNLYSLAGSEVQMWFFKIKDKRIWRIDAAVYSAGAENIAETLAKKYKPTKIESITVKNRMGAEYQNVLSTWTSGKLVLQVSKYASTIEDGYLSFLALDAPSLKPQKSTKDL